MASGPVDSLSLPALVKEGKSLSSTIIVLPKERNLSALLPQSWDPDALAADVVLVRVHADSILGCDVIFIQLTRKVNKHSFPPWLLEVLGPVEGTIFYAREDSFKSWLSSQSTPANVTWDSPKGGPPSHSEAIKTGITARQNQCDGRPCSCNIPGDKKKCDFKESHPEHQKRMLSSCL